MLVCEACGLRLYEHALRCPHCGRAVPIATSDEPDNLAGESGEPDSADTTPLRFSGDPAKSGPGPAPDGDDSDDGSDWDPDETSRFLPTYGSGRTWRNTLALVGIGIALVAAVSALAWLIGQTVGAPPVVSTAAPATPRATPPSSTPPRNATICTQEVARSTNTTCAVATRVLSAVRALGTDVPDSFRVTIVDPQSNKNATYVCAVKGWIECTGSRDARVYVKRLV